MAVNEHNYYVYEKYIYVRIHSYVHVHIFIYEYSVVLVFFTIQGVGALVHDYKEWCLIVYKYTSIIINNYNSKHFDWLNLLFM